MDNINDIESDRVSKQFINRQTTLNRARNNIMRLIKSNSDMKTFITLTFAKEPSYKDSKKMLNNFFNKLRRKQSNLKYIWVIEFGDKNKRLHYHLLTNINTEIKTAYKSKKSEEQKEYENELSKIWTHGFVDIRNLEAELGLDNIAKYVTTYIVKGLQNIDLGSKQRIYGYSIKTMNKPTTCAVIDKRKVESILDEYKMKYEVVYSNSYRISYEFEGKEKGGNVIYVQLKSKN